MEQVKNVCDMVEMIDNCTTHTCAFIFDQSSCHKKFRVCSSSEKDSGERRWRADSQRHHVGWTSTSNDPF